MKWWQEYREEFPVTNKCTYMDTAFDCGGSLIGKAAAAVYFEDWAEAASQGVKGGPGRQPFFEKAKKGKENLAELLGGVEPKNIAYTKNTNEGINAILQGFKFKPGDNIVTLNEEHPSVLMPCLNAELIKGIECRLATLKEDKLIPWELLWDQVDNSTVIIAVSHVQSSTGYKLDLKKLGEKCQEKGIFLVVDAVQSIGLSNFETKAWGVSAVSGAGYKGLGAYISLGFLYCNDSLLDHIWPVYVSSNFGMHVEYTMGLPRIEIKHEAGAAFLENCSTDYLGVYVLQAATERILSIGLDKIEDHIGGLYEKLYDGMSTLGYKLITPREKEHRCASMAVASKNSDDIQNYFKSQGVIMSGGTNRFRISIGPYTSPEDVEKTLQVARACPMR